MRKRLFRLVISLCALFTLGSVPVKATAEDEAKTVDVMFLHDTHSHLNEFSTVEDGEAQILGGFAKIKTLINEQKRKNPDTLLLDAGDFSMGTLIQTVFEGEAAELRMLGELGIDVTTLGNHEFDYRSKGLANMLNSATASKDAVPPIVLCNVDWETMESEGLTEEQQLLKDAFTDYGFTDYIVVEKNGVKIAVTGVFGKEAWDYAPTCALLFQDPVEAVKKTVEEIHRKETVDMIVCVSHSGTCADEDKSEDEILAKNVPELDLIISGHSHTSLEQPIVHGDTYIASVGEYGKNLGQLSMTQKPDGRWQMDSYQLIPVDDTIEPDEATQEKVDALMNQVDGQYLEQFGLTKDQILCTNDIAFSSVKDVYALHTELNLGSIMADAYTYAVEKLDQKDTHPVDVTVVPSGVIRDTYAMGNITTELVYNSFSLGIGEDGIPGYPLISVYLTGAELKTMAEIDASVSEIMTTSLGYNQ